MKHFISPARCSTTLLCALSALLLLFGCNHRRNGNHVEATATFIEDMLHNRVREQSTTKMTCSILEDKENFLKQVSATTTQIDTTRALPLSYFLYEIYDAQQDNRPLPEFELRVVRDSVTTNGTSAWVWFSNALEPQSPVWIVKLIYISDNWLVDLPILDRTDV